MNFHICTVYFPYVTPEMRYVYEKLKHEVEATIIPHWIQGEYFAKRRYGGKDGIQIEYRNDLLNTVPNGEWFIIIDSDEILYGNLKLIPQLCEGIEERGYDCATIMHDKKPGEPAHFFTRLIKKDVGMQYLFNHDRIWRRGQNILDPDHPKALLACIRILHLQQDYLNWPFQIFEREKTIGTYTKEKVLDVQYND